LEEKKKNILLGAFTALVVFGLTQPNVEETMVRTLLLYLILVPEDSCSGTLFVVFFSPIQADAVIVP
jgi:hypothetical protein